jgi:hypothetical protein
VGESPQMEPAVGELVRKAADALGEQNEAQEAEEGAVSSGQCVTRCRK